MNNDPVTYQHRTSILEKERSYRLSGDEVVWQEEGKPDGVFDLRSVRSVRLRYDPHRFATNRYLLEMADGRGDLFKLSNVSFRGVGDFEDRGTSFGPFVREIHERLLAQGSSADFRVGVSPVSYVFYWFLTVFILLVLIGAAIVLLTVGMVWLVPVKIVIIVFYLPTLFAFMRRAKPRTYDPKNIPEDFLPD